MSADFVSCHNREEPAVCIQCVEARDAAKHPVAHRAALTEGKAETHPAQDVSNVHPGRAGGGEKHTSCYARCSVVNYENTVQLGFPLQPRGSENAALGACRHQLGEVEGILGNGTYQRCELRDERSRQ